MTETAIRQPQASHPGAGWLVRPSQRPQAAVRLFCFPYGGGGAAAFFPWLPLLPPWIELNMVQLPGREARLREQPHTRIETVIDALLPVVTPLLDRPYAFFGHSMGTLIAFELARALRRAGVALPACLFVSGRRAPQAPSSEPQLHTLADGPFVAAMIRRYNGIPRAILGDMELLRLFLPTLRADLELFETYTYDPEPPLDCPIVAMGGQDDGRATLPDLMGWQQQTLRMLQVRQFPGDHFYIQGQRAEMLDALVETLEEVVVRDGSARGLAEEQAAGLTERSGS